MLNLDRSLPTQRHDVLTPRNLLKTSLAKAIKHTIGFMSAALVAAPVIAACNLTAFNSKLSQTGTAPFTSNACTAAQNGSFTHAPGDDPCPNDNVVRTNDTVVYQFNYKVLGNTIENNITFKSVLPQIAGKTVAVWDSLPPFCTAATDGISADGLTLTCNVGKRDRTIAGENGDLTEGLPALAKFTIAGANGQRLQPSTTVTTDSCTAADNGGASLAPEVEISARPKVDFKKDYPWNGGQTAYTRLGVQGYLVSWYVYMDQYDPAGSSSKGGQSVNSPVTLRDVPTNFPPNAVWFDCGRSGPYQGTISCPAEGTPVVNGVEKDLVIAAQAGDAQEDAEFLVAGGKNTLVQQQPLTGAPERMAEFYLRYFVPLSDINAAGGQINLRNDIPASRILGTDRSGLPIVDTNPANNGLNITVVGNAPGSLRKYVTKEWSGSPWAGAVPGTAATGEIQLQGTNYYGDEGTGVTYPNQVFYPGLWYTNPSVLSVFNSIICDTFNSAEVRVANIPNFPGHGAAYRYNTTAATHGTGGPFAQGYVVEYGVAPGVQSAATSRCDDGDAVWYPTLTAAASAGAREAINKVRIKIPEMVSGSNAEMLIAHQARPNVNGTVIEDYMSAKGPNLGTGGAWVLSGYDEVTNNGVGLGKRFT